jgi:PAS domain-containing protein
VRDQYNCPAVVRSHANVGPIERFGITLKVANGEVILADLIVSALDDDAGGFRGYVLSLHNAEKRLRIQTAADVSAQIDSFDAVSIPMVQLDGNGHILRVNKALIQESGVVAENLVGSTLKDLSMDPDPRISQFLVPKLLQGGLRAQNVPPRLGS